MTKLLRQREITECYGLPRSSLYELTDFPKPVKTGPRRVAWVQSEVEAWLEARLADREAA